MRQGGTGEVREMGRGGVWGIGRGRGGWGEEVLQGPYMGRTVRVGPQPLETQHGPFFYMFAIRMRWEYFSFGFVVSEGDCPGRLG